MARQDQAGNVNRGLSREIIFARMNRVMYQLTEISTSDEDTCSICLVRSLYFNLIVSSYILRSSHVSLIVFFIL